MFSAIDRGLARLIDGICIVLVAGLFALITFVVGTRLLGTASPAWSDEIVELMLAWLIFLGAAGLWRRGEHFRVDLLEQMLERVSARWWLAAVVECVSILFLGILTYYGAWFSWLVSDTSPTFSLPRAIWFACLPVSSGLMLAYSLARLIRLMRDPAVASLEHKDAK